MTSYLLIAIAALSILALGAVKSCHGVQQEFQEYKATVKAAGQEAEKQSKIQQRQDQEAHDNAIHDLKAELKRLSDDKRVAHIPICLPNPSRRPVPATPSATTGANEAARAEHASETTRDIGPVIDALVRKCDEIILEHNALVEWVERTR